MTIWALELFFYQLSVPRPTFTYLLYTLYLSLLPLTSTDPFLPPPATHSRALRSFDVLPDRAWAGVAEQQKHLASSVSQHVVTDLWCIKGLSSPFLSAVNLASLLFASYSPPCPCTNHEFVHFPGTLGSIL